MAKTKLNLKQEMYNNLRRSAVRQGFPPESLHGESVPEGVIANLAFDQRGSIEKETEKLFKELYGRRPSDLECAALIAEFKRRSIAELGKYASAVLLDASYGRHCDENGRTAIDIVTGMKEGTKPALLLALEETGTFTGPNGSQVVRFLRGWDVRQMPEYGAVGSKLLVSYEPSDPDEAFQRTQVLDFLKQSHEVCLPPFFEYLRQPKTGENKKSREYEKARPERILANDRLFSSTPFSDFFFVHKTELPVDLTFVEGTEPYERAKSKNQEHQPLWNIEQAKQYFREQDKILEDRTYIWLSAASPAFYEGVEFGLNCGSKASGVLCGRASFLGGLKPFIEGYHQEGINAARDSLQSWLETQGRSNMKTLNSILSKAHPWDSKYSEVTTD